MIESAIQKDEDAVYDNADYGTCTYLTLESERLLLKAKLDVLHNMDLGLKVIKSEFRESLRFLSISNAIK
jgi:hypothetical protein